MTALVRNCVNRNAVSEPCGGVYGWNRSAYWSASGVALSSRTFEYVPVETNGAP
jgi:hypothetical protein